MNDLPPSHAHAHHAPPAPAPPPPGQGLAAARGPPARAPSLYPPPPGPSLGPAAPLAAAKSFQGARGAAAAGGFKFQAAPHEYHAGPYSSYAPPKASPAQGRGGGGGGGGVTKFDYGGPAQYSSPQPAPYGGAYGYTSYGAAYSSAAYAAAQSQAQHQVPPHPQHQPQPQYSSAGFGAPAAAADASNPLGVLVSSATADGRKFRGYAGAVGALGTVGAVGPVASAGTLGGPPEADAGVYMAQLAERQVGLMQMKMSALSAGGGGPGDGLGLHRGAQGGMFAPPASSYYQVAQQQQQQQQHQQAPRGHAHLEPAALVTPTAAGSALLGGYNPPASTSAPGAAAYNLAARLSPYGGGAAAARLQAKDVAGMGHGVVDGAAQGVVGSAALYEPADAIEPPPASPPNALYHSITPTGGHDADQHQHQHQHQQQQHQQQQQQQPQHVCALCFGAGWDKIGSCGHRFHISCLQQWGDRSGCLVCAQNMQALAGVGQASAVSASMGYSLVQQQPTTAALDLNGGGSMGNGSVLGGVVSSAGVSMNRPPPIDTRVMADPTAATMTSMGSKRATTLTPTPSGSATSTTSSTGSVSVAMTKASGTSTGSGPKRKIKKLKECSVPGCDRTVRSRGLCKGHGGGRRCGYAGCGLSDQGGGFCISHGGGKRCQHDGCENSAQSRGLCKLHGGGSRCQVPNCTKSSQGRGLCRAHGGGRRCMVEGCNKTDRRAGYCVTHGADKKCIVTDCSKTGRMDHLCTKHYFERHPQPPHAAASMANHAGTVVAKKRLMSPLPAGESAKRAMDGSPVVQGL